MATAQREHETKLYECEVKRRRVKVGGGYEPFWKVKNIVDAIQDQDTEFRCKHCFGEVKLVRSRIADQGPHVEHKHRQDSEYCVAGLYFQRASDGREPRQSSHPVH